MATVVQRRFSGGELTPALHHGVDLVKYATGAKTIRNMFVQKWGGVSSRPGWIFKNEARYSGRVCRLVPLTIGDTSYVLEIGHKYIRVMFQGDYVFLEDAQNISGITQADPGVVTVSSHGFDNLDEVYIEDVGGMTELNDKTFAVAKSDTNTFVLIYNDVEHFLEPTEITAISKDDPGVVTAPGHGLQDGDEVYIYPAPNRSGDFGMVEVTERYFTVANRTDDTFELDGENTSGYTAYGSGGLVSRVNPNSYVDTSGFSAYTSGGTVRKIGVGDQTFLFDESDLREFQSVQDILAGAVVRSFVHQEYPPFYLARSDHNDWDKSSILFRATISPPNPTNNGAAGSAHVWVVTSVGAINFEESVASIATASADTPSTNDPITISWLGVPGAGSYNVYRYQYGVPSFIGSTESTSFVDDGIIGDVTVNPPEQVGFDLSDAVYPGVIARHQQRGIYASPTDFPLDVKCSRVGTPNSFPRRIPLLDDESISFSLLGGNDSVIRHIIGLRRLVILTDQGEWIAEGDAAGILLPGVVNLNQHSANGSDTLAPLIANNSVIYLQSGGSIVRDLGFDLQVDGYKGNDLSVFASHLFEGHTIIDWAYQKKPHSVVWAVRDDGVLLGLTYIREHDIWAWHRHDTDGEVESVCAVPEGTEDAVYLVVKRIIDGETKRYVERMADRRIDDIVDFIGMDCALTYDGRNTDSSHNMTLSGGTDWDEDETLTITSSESFFESDDVGNAIHLTGSDGTIIRFNLTAFTSSTVMEGRPHKIVPASMRNAAISNWAKAVDTVSGLDHLEGKDVSVFADGFVVASPNNSSYETIVVEDGSITLDRPYGVIHVGLPFIADLETLDIDSPGGRPLLDKKKLVNEVTIHVEKSRGIWVGGEAPSDDDVDPLEGLYEFKARDTESTDEPTDLDTGKIHVPIESHWSDGGHVFIRQVDPVPLTVLAVAPRGSFGG